MAPGSQELPIHISKKRNQTQHTTALTPRFSPLPALWPKPSRLRMHRYGEPTRVHSCQLVLAKGHQQTHDPETPRKLSRPRFIIFTTTLGRMGHLEIGQLSEPSDSLLRIKQAILE